MAEPLSRLQRRDRRLLGIGATGNGAGMSCVHILIGLILYEALGSAGVGLGLALYFLPMLLLGPTAGALADRFDRRQLLMWTELAQGGVLLVFALAAFAAALDAVSTLVLTFLSGCLGALNSPARLGYCYDLEGASRAIRALGRLNVLSRSGQLCGSLICGVLADGYGIGVAFGFVCSVYWISALAYFRLHTPGKSSDRQPESASQALWAYLQEMRSNRVLRTLVLVVVAVEILGYSYMTMLPELALERLDAGAAGLGILHAMRGAGGIIAGLTLTYWKSLTRPGRLYLWVIAVFALSIAALSIAQGLFAVATAVAVLAATAAANDILSQGMMQRCVPDRLRGRAMGLWVVAVGTGPLGHVEIGMLSAALGLSGALAWHALALLAVSALAAVATPELRKR